MDDQVFSDGLGAITSVGGTIRIDLVAYSPTEIDARGQPALTFRQRVIMPVDAFLLAADKIQEVAAALTRSGQRPARVETATPEKPLRPVPVETPPASPQTPPPPAPSGRPFP